jgi:hypothetical protein
VKCSRFFIFFGFKWNLSTWKLFIRELNPISFSFIEAKIYTYSVRVKFLCDFCASFVFKINPHLIRLKTIFLLRIKLYFRRSVVWRMTGMYVFRHLGQDNFRVLPKKNGIYRHIVLPIDTIIIGAITAYPLKPWRHIFRGRFRLLISDC